MSYSEAHRTRPGDRPDLRRLDPRGGSEAEDRKEADERIATYLKRLERQQYLLYAEGRRSLLIILQGMDAAGKDGVIRHVFSGMNPQGVRVAAFKQPSPEEAAHDFLWRAHKAAPARGEVAIFNRSHYEDVLIVRVREMVPPEVWRPRYEAINAFEAALAADGARILKFFLHISPEEQLDRFRERLENPERQWKISESDYTERKLWDRYLDAYEDALERTSTPHAPWFVIPSDHKWRRNLVVAEIIAETLEEMDLRTPPATVDLADIRRRFHAAREAEKRASHGTPR